MELRNFWARYAVRKEEDKIDEICGQATCIASLSNMHDKGEFAVGGFTVISADNGWDITIKEGEHTLVHAKWEGDGHCSYCTKRAYVPDDGWQARWKQAHKSFVPPALFSGVTQHLTRGTTSPSVTEITPVAQPNGKVVFGTDQPALPHRHRGEITVVPNKNLPK